MIKMSPSKGKLLISEPSILNDKSFNRSVIYLTEHNKDEGCIGFIINKPTQFVLNDLIPAIHNTFTVYNGGPVEKENLYFIHKIPHLIPNSIQIDKDIYWGGNFEALTALLNNKEIKPTDIRFFLGYTGWSVNQLNDELNESSWKVVNNTYPDLFKVDSDFIWRNQLLKFGGDYQIWANAPKNPSLN